jgi:hypothetical protein
VAWSFDVPHRLLTPGCGFQFVATFQLPPAAWFQETFSARAGAASRPHVATVRRLTV